MAKLKYKQYQLEFNKHSYFEKFMSKKYDLLTFKSYKNFKTLNELYECVWFELLNQRYLSICWGYKDNPFGHFKIRFLDGSVMTYDEVFNDTLIKNVLTKYQKDINWKIIDKKANNNKN